MLSINIPFRKVRAECERPDGSCMQAHTCDNLLELPNYWESLLQTEGFQGSAANAPASRLPGLRAECERILDDRLTLAITCASGYGLDMRD